MSVTTEASQTGPCAWPMIFPCSDDPTTTECEHLGSSAASGALIDAATEYLWRWTGQRFGTCPVTVRPCRADCTTGQSTYWGAAGVGSGIVGTYGGSPWTPALIRGRWFNLGCGACGDSCGCSSVSALRLPGPVASVTEVQFGGEVLPAAAYRVDNGRLLVRQDGGIWPTCQDLSAPLGADGTWAVTYEHGTPVPNGGQIAAGLLACELAKAACGDSTCSLPTRVQTITRQGVTIAMLDAFDDIDKGHTGIWLIDSWVASVTKQPKRMTVSSPDRRSMGRARQTTWQG